MLVHAAMVSAVARCCQACASLCCRAAFVARLLLLGAACREHAAATVAEDTKWMANVWQVDGRGSFNRGCKATVAAKGVVAGRPPGAAASAAALPQSARGLSSSALPDADVCDMKERLALVLRCDVRKTHLGALAAACASQCGPCAVHVDSDSLGRACLGRGLGVSLHPTPRGRGSSGARRPRVH